MRRYQTASQRASGESSTSPKPPSGWVSAGSSNCAGLSAARPPLAGPKESAAKTATRSTAPRVRQHAQRGAQRLGAAQAPRARRGDSLDAMPGTISHDRASFVGDHASERPRGGHVVARSCSPSWWTARSSRRGTQLGTAVAGGELSPVATHAPAARAAAGLRDDHRDRRWRWRSSQFDGGQAAGHRHPRLLRRARPGGGLRRAPDARQRDRRDPAGDHAADPDRRPRRPSRAQTGEVEDVQLTYTYIRLDDGTPPGRAQRAAGAELDREPHVVDPRVQVEVSVWMPPDADPTARSTLIAPRRTA